MANLVQCPNPIRVYVSSGASSAKVPVIINRRVSGTRLLKFCFSLLLLLRTHAAEGFRHPSSPCPRLKTVEEMQLCVSVYMCVCVRAAEPLVSMSTLASKGKKRLFKYHFKLVIFLFSVSVVILVIVDRSVVLGGGYTPPVPLHEERKTLTQPGVSTRRQKATPIVSRASG